MTGRLSASIRSDRVEKVTAEIVNVTASSFYAVTPAPFEFGERVEITLFDITFPGEVALATDQIDPAGAVIVFDAPPSVLGAIAELRPTIDVVGRRHVEAPKLLTTADLIIHPPVEETTDRQPIQLAIPAADTLPGGPSLAGADGFGSMGLAADLVGAPDLSPDDALAAAEREIAALQASIGDVAAEPVAVPPPASSPPPPAAAAVPVPQIPSTPPMPAAAAAAANALARMASGVGPPRTVSGVSSPPRAGSNPRAKGGGLPAAVRPKSGGNAPLIPDPPQSVLQASQPPQPEPELPELEADGVTLRFASMNQYQKQHRANIAHGGIIARSTPLPMGTQKFLGIQIPGKGRYTVSARVTFVGEGTIGFTIESFPIHRDKLKAFAG